MSCPALPVFQWSSSESIGRSKLNFCLFPPSPIIPFCNNSSNAIPIWWRRRAWPRSSRVCCRNSKQHSDRVPLEVAPTNSLLFCMYVCFDSVGLDTQGAEYLEQIAAKEQKLIPFQTLAQATNNFHPTHKLGEGGFGPVYKVSSKSTPSLQSFLCHRCF